MDSRNAFKVETCLRWTTEVPEKDISKESDVFRCGAQETFFRIEFNRKKLTYFLYVINKSDYQRLEEYELSCFIETPDGPTYFCHTMVANTKQSVTSYFEEDISALMDRFRYKRLTFVFVFEDVELDLPASFDTNASWDHLETLSADIGHLQNDPAYDVILISRDGEQYPAHSIVLRARARKFDELLTGCICVESRAPNTQRIPELDRDSLAEFVYYLCWAKFSRALTRELAQLLHSASLVYGVDSLTRKCSEFLEESLSEQNALEILTVARTNRDQNLEDRVVDYLFQNRLLDGEKWKDFRYQWQDLAFDIYHKFYQSHI